MELNNKLPEINEIASFLEEYGWKYRRQTADDKEIIISNYTLTDADKGILLTFRIVGEFVMVSTVGLLKNVPIIYSARFLEINDKIKLVKIYSTSLPQTNLLDIDTGFELWAESWNKETFFAFMDMLCLGIEKVLDEVKRFNIPHETSFIAYR